MHGAMPPMPRSAAPPCRAFPPPRLLPALLLLLSAAGVAAGPAAAQPREPFRVVNRTGAEATALHAVRSGRGDWGRNFLDRPLASGGAYVLRPSESAGCRFDIRLVLRDGREARLRDP